MRILGTASVLLFFLLATANAEVRLTTNVDLSRNNFKILKVNAYASSTSPMIAFIPFGWPSEVSAMNELVDAAKSAYGDNFAIANVVVCHRVKFSILVFTLVTVEVRADIIQFADTK